MPKVLEFPQRHRPEPTDQRLGSGYRQVAWLLEAADEATLAGQEELASVLVDRARQMVSDLAHCEMRAA